MHWYKIILTENEVGLGALERAYDVFTKKMFEHADSTEIAVFDCKDHEATTTILYISPKMALISPREIVEFSAVESGPPTGDEHEFGVLVARDDATALNLIRS